MKVVIGQAAYCMTDEYDIVELGFDGDKEKLLNDYPYLRKYADYYHQGFDAYYDNNVIIKDMDEKELQDVIKMLTKKNKLVIEYEDKYWAERYGTDFKITIYDDYLE